MHKGHSHPDMDGDNSQSNGTANPQPQRTTSTFTTHSILSDSGPGSSTIGSSTMVDQSTSGGQGGGWGNTDAGFSGSGLENEGFGGPPGGGDGQNNGDAPRRPIGDHRGTSHGAEEVVTVTALPEKEGTFLFQHRNYQVASTRRNSKVIRRYSDFVWLLDCLHKRYPFRQLPLLPPKRVASEFNRNIERTSTDPVT